MDAAELQIIKECQEGNLESFIGLYDRYAEKIYRFLYFQTGHVERAEDLTSQTFLKAMDRIGTFREGSTSFQAWLYRIAHNNFIDEVRKHKPTQPIEQHFDLSSNEDIALETDQGMRHAQLLKLLQTLPQEQRELVRMRLWDELSYSEIAAVTGKSEGALKMQFSRTIAKLQQHTHLLLIPLTTAMQYFYGRY